MRTITIILSIIILISFLSCIKTENPSLAITNVTIIDATGAPPKTDMTVLIANNRIIKIGKADKIKVPDDVQIIKASGKFLIPGLWDMHVHWYNKKYLPLFIANGVTGIRHMWGIPDHFQWRKEIAEGKLLGPRMEIASPPLDGPNPIWPYSIPISNAEEARATVRRLKAKGYDFIKVIHLIPREAFFALAEECKKLGIPFAGHVPITVNFAEAVEAGLKSNEHLICILLCCSTQEEKFKKELKDAICYPRRKLYLETFSQEKADILFHKIAQYNCWQCPTLTLCRSAAYRVDEEFRDDPRIKYIPQDIKYTWNLPSTISSVSFWTKKTYQKLLELIGAMRKVGVRFLAGTDVINPYCFPGFSLHDELDLLVQGGLTPMEALQAATLNAAEYLERLDSLGTIEQGKIADLVLLEADPLEDIRNTQKISSVVFNGTLYDKASLQKMLAKIEKLASRKSIGQTLFQIIEQKNVQTAIQQYHELKENQTDQYSFDVNELDLLGYQLLKLEKIKDAIEIFKLNVEVYPEDSYVYDSLGETYMINGDKELSIITMKSH